MVDLDELERVAKMAKGYYDTLHEWNAPCVEIPAGDVLAMIAEIRAARAQTPKADSDGWIPWNGGKCPLPAGTKHEVRRSNGITEIDENPETWNWEREGYIYDIIAYRVLP